MESNSSPAGYIPGLLWAAHFKYEQGHRKILATMRAPWVIFLQQPQV